MGLSSNPKLAPVGLQKQYSMGPTTGLPPKAGSATPAPTNDQNPNNNTMSFESYIRNCKQYNVTPKKGLNPLTRNKSEGKLNTISTVQFDEESNKGVLIYGLKELFGQIDKYKDDSNELSIEEESKEQGANMSSNTFVVRCSYFEIYNDTVYDLLSDINEFDKPLIVCEDSKKKDFYVKGLKQIVVDTLDECMDILKMGEFNRHYAATSMNHQSSRSHTVFRLSVQNVEHLYKNININDADYSVCKESILNFIDLAGSEKVSNHHTSKFENRGTMLSDAAISSSIKDRVEEGKHINKSLFFLTQVISMMAKRKSDHIPYRNSPLTKILRSSLGGNSRTSIILCATPTVSQYEQTLSTMRFGFSAKQIENKICANITKNGDEEALKAMISDYESKLRNFENDRDMINELQKQKQLLKQRLQKANENIITNAVTQRQQVRKNVDHAVLHWDCIGIVHSSTEVEDIIPVAKINSGWKVASCEISPDPSFIQILNKNYVKSIKNQNSELKKTALEIK